ncbi:2Fe-2S ferredoxin [Advenella incenata]|uniref:2Fe-2S ferredoxin n=1 Tax=Advenella incenata TaxID=267800 RepID=A0A4Q7VFT9_9BURK|nr:2Fe-2S iron-sulfur cluster-binding protein [Advenella incenata]RZT94858.1 2Fe-2S ferredoxin [Advenella incenata]
MVKAIFHLENGEIQEIEAEEDNSLMFSAVRNDVGGILGECGGAMSCGTCHVYVDPKWVDLVPAASAAEIEMLEALESYRPESRLACQIELSKETNGIEVMIAPAE